MTATLAQIRDQVQTHLEHVRNPTLVDRLINQALNEASMKYDWPWLVTRRSPISLADTVTAGTTYSFPSSANLGDSARVVILAVYLNDMELQQVSGLDSEHSRDMRERSWAIGGDGSDFDLDGGIGNATFTIRPSIESNDTLEVSWKRLENRLVDDADTTLCPQEFAFGPVTSLAVARGHLSHPDESNQHAFWMRDYRMQLKNWTVEQRPTRGPVLPRTRPGRRLLESY